MLHNIIIANSIPASTDGTTLTPQTILLGCVIAIALFIPFYRFLNILGPNSLKNPPPRPGKFSGTEAFGTFLLFALGPILALQLASTFGYVDLQQSAKEISMNQSILRFALMQTGMLLAVFFGLVRAHQLMENGIPTLGLKLKQIPTGLGAGFIAALLSFPFILLFNMLFTNLRTVIDQVPDPISHTTLHVLETAIKDNQIAVIAAIFFMAVIAAPIIEEIIFRGIIQTAIFHIMQKPGNGLSPVIISEKSRWWPIISTSSIFTAVHISAVEWHALPSLFILSLTFGYVYERTGNLYASITLHLLFNATNIIGLYFATTG